MIHSDTSELGTRRPHDTERPDVETSSDRYTTLRFGGPTGRWLLAQQSHAVRSLLDRMGPAPCRVLEVGGGHGQVTSLLLERGHDVVVHGSSDDCFERIEAKRRAHPDRLARCVGSLRALPFADDSVDIVIAVRVLGHVTHWRDLLAEMARIASRFVVVEFARKRDALALQWVRDAAFALKNRAEGTTRPFYAYSEEALAGELGAHGFTRVATVGQFALPMVLHRVMRSPAISAALEGSLRAVGVGNRSRSPALMLAERVTGPPSPP